MRLAQRYGVAAHEVQRDLGSPACLTTKENAEKLPYMLLQTQAELLQEIAVDNVELARVLHTLRASAEVATAALQLLVTACHDLHLTYKNMAKQQLKMRRKKQCQPESLNPFLLEMSVPADHLEMGLPGGRLDQEKEEQQTINIPRLAASCTFAAIALSKHIETQLAARPAEESQYAAAVILAVFCVYAVMVRDPCNLYTKEPFPQSHAGEQYTVSSRRSLSLSCLRCQ